MHLTLLAVISLAGSALQSPPPRFHTPAPSALAGFTQSQEVAGLSITGGVRCLPKGGDDEIVVCAPIRNRYGTGAVDPVLARRYSRRPAGPDAGVQHPSSAMEVSRCAVVRCPPQGMISILGSKF